MGSKRRKAFLPISDPKYRIYHDHFDNCRISSPILTPGERIDIHTTIMDQAGMQGLLVERIGDEEGNYLRNGHFYIALIPGIERSLEAVENNYQKYLKDLKDQGRRPVEMYNTSFWEQKLKALAGLDVTLEEVELLEERLKAIADQVQEQDNDNMLKYGPVGNSLNWGTRSPTPNQIKTMDGQSCDYIGDFLCITDPRSPYKGMSVADYRDLVDTYKASQREAGLSSLCQIDRKDLPVWNSGVKNHMKKEVEKI